MKKYFLLLAFISIPVLDIVAQNWKIYTTANSNSPHNLYNMVIIDTANTKYFNEPGGFSGDKTVFFDNDTTWQSKLSVEGSTSFAYGLASCIDHTNVLWEKSSGNDLYSLSGRVSGLWQTYSAATTGLISMNSVRDIAVDHQNNKYFATYMGLVKYDDATFTLIDTSNSTIPIQSIYKIVCDKHDGLWITGNTLLAHYDGINWTSFALPTSNIYKMVVDSSDNIWFGQISPGIGLYKFDGSSWTNYNTSNSSIPSNSVAGITVDKNNILWFTTPVGISRFDGTSWFTYDASQGYPGTGSGFLVIDRYDNIWNTSGNGVIVFNETGIIGIDEIDKQMGAFETFPNPASDRINIRFNAKADDIVNISVINTLGQVVKPGMSIKAITGVNENGMDISTLPKGVYFIRISSSKELIVKKFIKQ